MARSDPLPRVHPTDRLMGYSPVIQALRAQIRHLSAFDTVGSAFVPTLLLQGETATGKGLVARVIHDSGPRAQSPFIDVNCAAIPETLLEVELFGFEAGTFTDAKRAKPGLLESASHGTLFLDEIDALALPLQAKLLSAIEEKRVRRLGAVASRQLDVKLIAATPTDLSVRVADGRFRSDLYHRLAVVIIDLPPLRERGEDILLLARYFLVQYAQAHALLPKRLSRDAETWLQRHGWPGNVRELSHLMERVTLLSMTADINASTLEQLCLTRPQQTVLPRYTPVRGDAEPLDEPARIRLALGQTGGNVVQAARLLGITASLGLAYALSGRSAEALRLLGQVQIREETLAATGGSSTVLRLGEAYLGVGRLNDAFQLAELAQELSHGWKERGNLAWSLWLLGEIAMHREPPELEQAETHYRQALGLAEELGMRPLVAHCCLGLGTLHAQVGQQDQAQVELSGALALYRALNMMYWPPQVEAMLVQFDGLGAPTSGGD